MAREVARGSAARCYTLLTNAESVHGQQRLDRAPLVHRTVALRGLIERQRDSEDRRVVYSALTEKGLELIDAAIADHLEIEHAMLAGLSESEREQLAGLLAKLERSIQDAAEASSDA